MARAELTIETRVAWWLQPYLAALSLMCLLHGASPDPERLALVVRRAIRIRVGAGAWVSVAQLDEIEKRRKHLRH